MKAIRSARPLNKLWKDWIANISISISFIGHKRDPTVRVITNLRETTSWTLLKNVASDGNIRGPSEGYPEMINVWKEMEKLLDTGASFIKMSTSSNDFTRQSQVNRSIQFLHQDVIDFTPPLQGCPSNQPSRDASLPSAGGAQVILRGQRNTVDCILSSW
jgi:hypothetical protein